MARVKIAHLTSVHPRYDTRIFLKMCRTLSISYDVTLIVADGKGDEEKDGIKILDVGVLPGRLNRIFKTTAEVYKKAMELDVVVYHLHDPELIPIGVKLKRSGKVVIFDAHEDVPKQILSKPYLNRFFKFVLSKAFSIYEKVSCKKLDAVIAATPQIAKKYLNFNIRSIDINNFPLLEEMDLDLNYESRRANNICYIGGITKIRGILEIVQALEFVKAGTRLLLGGTFSEVSLKKEITVEKGWKSVEELGWLDRKRVRKILRESIAGLVTFLPAPNHIDAQPNKMFEYMSAGLPVIASNFPLWREIIEGNECGLCIDPLNPKEIAEAINYLISHPEEARLMGERGRIAIQEKYNWSNEANKLISLYNRLLTQSPLKNS